jgi:uncharacterized membrane protein YbhN (UPF0104 family)
VSRSDTQPVGLGLSRRVLLSLLCLLLTATGLALGWSSLEPSFAGAAEAARESNPALLFLAGLLFAAVPASCGLLWREAIIGAGGGLSRWDACARYGVGSLVNTFAPAHVGDVVRAALLLRALPCGEPRRMVRCFGLVQGVRIAALAALLLASTLPVELALLPLFLAAPAIFVLRDRAELIGLGLMGPAAKVAAVAVALTALGVPEPLSVALVIVPALELAALLPLTPANLGAASAAISVVLHARGMPLADAVPASIVLHGVETAAGISYGSAAAAALLFSRRNLVARRGAPRPSPGRLWPSARPASSAPLT